MGFPYLLLLAVGLSMDAMAVAIAAGCGMGKPSVREALRIGAFFGGFQALMPVLGWLAGLGVRDLVSGVDHWIAFGLLGAIGAKMIVEAARPGPDRCEARTLGLRTLLLLSVATSIDALAVGLGLSFLDVPILLAAGVIGAVTFAISFAGVCLGWGAGRILERWAGAAGGIVLAGIGTKILLDHMA